YINTLAAGLVYKLAEAGIVGQVEREALERLFNRVVAVVADRRDLSAAGVLHHQALQQVVDVGGGKGEVDPAGAVQFALALEIAHATAEEVDVRDRQAGRHCSLLDDGRPLAARRSLRGRTPGGERCRGQRPS